MFSIPYALYLFMLATALAFLEIQIEGAHGWAENLPCWRPNPDSILAEVYSRIMQDKPLTGYHVGMPGLVFIILHSPFFSGVAWESEKELEVISCFFLLAVCWDFLWFVWNPSYGLKGFRPQAVWWHKKWVGPLPTDYLIGLTMSVIFATIAALFGGAEVLRGWGVIFAILGGLTLLSCAIAPLTRKGGA